MYPSVRYHRTLEPVIVNDPLEDEQLGPDWADTPAAFENRAGSSEPDQPGDEVDTESTDEARELPAQGSGREGNEVAAHHAGERESQQEAEHSSSSTGRCPCGKYTVANAAKRNHVCGEAK